MQEIGSIEMVQVRAIGARPVAAKVDSGADSSSIWAANISEKDGILHYRLVAGDSVKTKRYTTHDYSRIRVKNSFGHTEDRYRVNLDIQIGKRSYRALFTLADRSNNKYPILLGKKLLDHRFTVNTAKQYVQKLQLGDQKNGKLLIISKQKTAKVEQFVHSLSTQPHLKGSVDSCYLNQVVFTFVNGCEPEITHGVTGESLAEYSTVYIKSYLGQEDVATSLAHLLTQAGTHCIDNELVHNDLTTTKLGEMARLHERGVSIPKTIVATKQSLLTMRDLKYPLVLKAIDGMRGRDNLLISNHKTLIDQLQVYGDNRWLLAQEYVPNDGYSRVIVLGGVARLEMYRAAHPHKNPLKQHLNNPRGGVNATKIPVGTRKTDVQRAATFAARALKRDIAGVDVLRHSDTGEIYVLEVNYNPEMQSGAFTDEKLTVMTEYLASIVGDNGAKMNTKEAV